MSDTLIIGAGLAGLTAAWQGTQKGRKVRLVAKGWGMTHWHAGCIDVLGYYPLQSQEPVSSPATAIEQLITGNPQHPYALHGVDKIAQALDAFQALCAEAGYRLQGSLDKNWLLPSAVGTFRPTCLAPETMTAGDLSQTSPMLIVGFKHLGDFYPNVVADNLSQQGIPAQHATLDLPTLRQRRFTTPVILANLMEQPAFRAEVVQRLKPQIGEAQRIGFPAVLGMQQATAVKQDLQSALGCPIFEIPTLPPSVAGMRLHHILVDAIERHGGRVFDGMEAVKIEHENGRVTAVHTEAAARTRAHRFQQYVLATGGILGGGIEANYEGQVREILFDLPLTAPQSRLHWFKQEFLDKEGHPIYKTGVTVNQEFRPLNGDGQPVYENLFAAGTTLAHCEVIRERSAEGVAVTTGFQVGQIL